MTITPSTDKAIAGLIRLGFTQMEADVYIALLRESPATGYRVATAIGKATANTYKALRSLTEKGAVLTEDGDGSMYRAVPAQELLRRFTREFETQRDATLDALEEIGSQAEDLGVYRLDDPQQVLQRAREMLARAREVAVLIAFPAPLARLVPDIEAAAARGVDIGVKAYMPIEIRGADVILSTESSVWLNEIPGEELMMVIDAEEYLIALLDGDEVHQAIWSASPFLGFVYHNGIALEHHGTKLAHAIKEGVGIQKLRAMLAVERSPANTPGHRRLKAMRRQGKPGTSDTKR